MKYNQNIFPLCRAIGCEVLAASTDSHFSHLAWVNTPREKGGLGEMKIPLLADKGLEIARAYGVLKVGGKGNKISSFFGKSDFPRSCLLGICVPFPWEIDANICPTQQKQDKQCRQAE